jgi:hypothetical protein
MPLEALGQRINHLAAEIDIQHGPVHWLPCRRLGRLREIRKRPDDGSEGAAPIMIQALT